MTALEELVSEHPWWDLAQLILWIGTRARSRWATEELKRRTEEERLQWSVQAERVLRVGKLEVTYLRGDTPRKVEAHEFPYLRIQYWRTDVPLLRWDTPFGGELSGELIRAADIVRAFPPQEAPADAAPRRTHQRGPESSIPAIREELDQWIEGGSKRVLKELKQWTPDEGTTLSIARLARALAAWNRANGGKETSPSTIQREMRPRLQEAYELI